MSVKYISHIIAHIQGLKLISAIQNQLSTNPYNKTFRSAGCILCLVYLSACSTQTNDTPAPTSQSDQIELSETSKQAGDGLTQEPVKIDDKIFREAITALEENELSKAQRLFTTFIRQNPKLSGAYINLALIHFKQKKYSRSIELINKAIKLNPDQAPAYNLRAQINIQNGKIKDAKSDYLKAIRINPEYVNAQYNLALLYDIYLQEIELAIKHYEIYQSLIKRPDEANQEWITHLKGTLKNG